MSDTTYKKAVELAKSGHLDAAAGLCRQLLEHSPAQYQYLYLSSSICLLSGQYEECRTRCNRLLDMDKTNADVYLMLAAISSEYDHDDVETDKWLRMALDHDPINIKVLINLGNLKFSYGQLEEAKSFFEQVNTISPSNADAIGGLAMIEARNGRYDAAIDACKHALEADPSASAIRSNLILALYKIGRKEEAINYSLMTASMESPGIAAVSAMTVAKMHGLFSAAEALLPFALKELAKLPKDLSLYSFSSLSFLSASPLNNEEMHAIHRQAACVIRRELLNRPFQEYSKAFSSLAKIRVGYLSSDFNNHVLGHFFRGIVNHRDRVRFEVYLYSNLATEKEDEVTQQYRAVVDHFSNVFDLSDLELAEKIHEDGIHILIEMNGHLGADSSPRLPVLAYKPAPVQIAYLNYPYSYGMYEMDYVISDPWLNGPDNAVYFDEKPLEMPDSFATIGDYFEQEIADTPARIRNGFLTFGSLSNIYKLNSKTIALWSKVLLGVPGSRIYLNHPGYVLKVTRDSVIAEFNRHGVAEGRVSIVWERHPSGSHLRYYNEMDISLDTMPLTGGTTTIDSLWMAVPVITLVGKSHAQRLSYSILKNVGVNLNDCIALEEGEFVARAVELAMNSQHLDDLRALIPVAMRSGILCDAVNFTKQMESVYIKAWNDKFPSHQIGETMSISQTIALPCANGRFRIVVEDDSNDMFNYILREQQSWFEVETTFFENIADKFSCFWDFSDDPGVFSIPVAYGQSSFGGKTTAIRSSRVMQELLNKSISENGLKNLNVVEEPATNDPLPDIVRFSLDYNDGEGSLLAPWLDKIDTASPLILASLRNPHGTDLSAMPTLAERGYQSYRLLPGYDLLVPHRFGDRMYGSDINLFFCKPDRAEILSQYGLLCLASTEIENMPAVNAKSWADLLGTYSYTSTHLQSWIANPIEGKWGEMYLTALNLYAEAKNSAFTPSQRFARIQLLQTIMNLLLQSEATAPRLLSGIRFMGDSGNREMAIQWARMLYDGVQGMSGILLDEPFWATESIWEDLPIESDEVAWVSSIAAISLERLSRFSTWFTGDQSLSVWQGLSEYSWFKTRSLRMMELIHNRYKDGSSGNMVGHIGGKPEH